MYPSIVTKHMLECSDYTFTFKQIRHLEGLLSLKLISTGTRPSSEAYIVRPLTVWGLCC